MTMEDMNACTQCGFMTNNFADFKEHIEQHESERHLTTTNTSSRQEWSEDLDELSSTPNLSSPEQFSPATASSPPVSGINSTSKITTTTTTTTTTTNSNSKTMHVCPHCNFETCMSQHMKSHLDAHERHQGQMYQCDICHMQFSQKANMHRHRMRHTGVKPYQCRYCLKKFFRKDQMQEHSMTHIKTGADFDCPVALCDKQFSQHASLRTHLDEAHAIAPSTPASCKRCSLLFANSRRLLLHYQTKHDEGDTSSIIVTSPVKPKSENSIKDIYSFTSPVSKKQRRANAQTIVAAIQEQLKFIKQESMKPSISEDMSRCMDYEQTGYGMTNEEWLLSLSSVNTPTLITDIKPETALQQLWTRTSNAGSENTEDQSHSPSVDSGSSSATDGEGGDKEQQECMHCGMIFMDQTLYLLHKGLHSDSDPWKCNLCGHGCGDKYMFTTHVISSDHSC
ncbi:zinc finger, C2H2 type [Onchocerca flexuosa]|uniref:Zinc finger, C2H2 type n=1 Tax=Onchocerca flexuosa TaxID=387005 RepID=A0A238BYG5_9BILA|nr:zinc finger, C2H2 type [Onchocerca flexuosa]